MYYAYIDQRGKYYYFNGQFFDTATQSRKLYKTVNGLKGAIKRVNVPTVYLQSLFVAKVAIKNRRGKSRKKNPVKRSINQNIEKAKKQFKQFTGHDPDYIDTLKVPRLKHGFQFGSCDGILYTTVRDGQTEKYTHTFKKSSRPALVANYDGDFIALVGGNYSFTDRGIVDN